VGWALAIDALTHDGPADPARVDSAVCAQMAMPGVDQSQFPANYGRYLSAVGEGFNQAEQLDAEPPLRCYVTSTCPASPASGASGGACAKRRVTIRLDRWLRSARVTVRGKRVKVRHRRHRLVVTVALRRNRPTRVRIRGVTRGGRIVHATRRLRACRA
jgi:hypothetical protein